MREIGLFVIDEGGDLGNRLYESAEVIDNVGQWLRTVAYLPRRGCEKILAGEVTLLGRRIDDLGTCGFLKSESVSNVYQILACLVDEIVACDQGACGKASDGLNSLGCEGKELRTLAGIVRIHFGSILELGIRPSGLRVQIVGHEMRILCSHDEY